MQLLLGQNNIIVLIADHIVFGTFENEQKWALYDENNHIFLYALDDNYRVETIAIDAIPEDVNTYGKYIYQNGEIVQNPDWIAPPPTIEDQVEAISSDISDDWNRSKTYDVGEYVMYANKMWICKIKHENMAPAANSPYWEKVNIASEFNRLAALINKEA